MYQYSPNHNAVFPGSGPAYRWRLNVGAKINGGLAIVGDTLYAETFAPAVIAVDRRTGKLLWRTTVPNIVMTTPIVADGLVIVGTGRDRVALDNGKTLIWGSPGGDEIIALRAGDGKVVWTHQTVGEDMPSPALVRVGGRDAVVFANGDDHVRALDVRSGRLLWATPIVGVSTMASAAASRGIVYVLAGVSADMHMPDHVYAVRASDGYIVWKAPYGNADCSPVVADGKVVVEDASGAGDGVLNNVYAIDTAGGRLAWSSQSNAGSLTGVGSNEEAIAAMVDRGVLFQSLPAVQKFAAFDLRTGHVLWSTPTHAAVKMSAIADNGRIYVGDTGGYLYRMAEGDGSMLAQRKFPMPFTTSSPVIVDRTLYISDWSTLYAMPVS
jgi:outer membrane protein assembly factor BamB